jgi:hypothetical protein
VSEATNPGVIGGYIYRGLNFTGERMASTTLYEVADVVRETGKAGATVRAYADSGRLPVAARTPRGLRLFRYEDVQALVAELGKAGGAA